MFTDEPRLVWSGPDEDGDLVVELLNVPRWHLAVHGKTIHEALRNLGECMLLAHDAEDTTIGDLGGS